MGCCEEFENRACTERIAKSKLWLLHGVVILGLYIHTHRFCGASLVISIHADFIYYFYLFWAHIGTTQELYVGVPKKVNGISLS